MSVIQKRLDEDLKKSMREGDIVRRSAIRYLRAQIQNEEIAKQKTLDDNEIVGILSKQAANCRESIAAFKNGNRLDLAEKEESELEIILEYLPKQMSLEEITTKIEVAIQQLKASGPQDIGKVMGMLIPQVKGKADNRMVSQIALEKLNNLDE